jgi:hypothetical protein
VGRLPLFGLWIEADRRSAQLGGLPYALDRMHRDRQTEVDRLHLAVSFQTSRQVSA